MIIVSRCADDHATRLGQTAKIVTGSFRGMLRIYSVKQRDFKADDLLLEQDLGSAILQIAAGRFSSS